MAASNSRNRPHSLSTPLQISKDMEALDNPIPLSPQWLLPKPGENKTGMMQGENNLFPGAALTDCSDVIKSPGHGEEMHESQKKEDMFKLTFLDMESARSDRWRDEERDTNPSMRRDRVRESDKETGDTHRIERWVGNSSMRSFGEVRQVSTDRWVDSNRDANYDQRRESKWNTRWGPDNREMGKWADVGKHNDMTHEKGHSHAANFGKHEREGDHFRPWRSSSLQSRGRAEPLHHQTQMANKGSTYGHGRGRGEVTPSTFSMGRGRSNFGAGSANNYFAHSRSVGTISNRGDNSVGELSPSRYSRIKLLDIYRVTDVRSSNKILDGLLRVSSLTQEEPLEPLALCAPSPEESAVLKGIDKGDIIGSGASQITKDGSTARSSVDNPPSRLSKLGSKDDVSLPVDDANDKLDNSKGAHSKILDCSPHEKQEYTYVSNAAMKGMENHCLHAESKSSADAVRDDSSAWKKSDEVTNDRDTSIKGNFPAQSGFPWHIPSVSEHARSSRDWSDEPRNIQADIGQSQELKDASREWENGLPDQSYAYNDCKWQIVEDSVVRKCTPTVVDWEHEARKILQPSPDNLVLYYKDPQGQVQGPFSGSDIIGWFEAGYFGIDLQVRLANAPSDSPFSLLGDVMPHLRAKARPPPGFNTTKQNEPTELSGRSSLSGCGMVLPGSSGIDLVGNDYRHARGSSIEAENRFLESLISGDFGNTSRERFTFTEGLPGFSGHTSSCMTPLRAESGDALNLLATRLNLEQQKPLPHPYPYWPARDTTPVVPSSDILRDSTIRQADILSSIVDVPRQPHLQNVEMSVHQGLSDRSATGMKNGAGGWPNISVQGGLDPFKDKIELYHGQNTPGAQGMQQHKIQPPNQPSIPTVHPQSLDSPSILTDKLLSSGLVQDAQLLSLMQQQYLLQLQSQQSMLGPHLSLMDRILLLNKQQKQEEQQHLLRQQQQLLSQVLSEQHLVQRFGDPSSGQLQLSPKPVVNVPTDPSELHLSHQLFQSSLQVPGSVMPDDRNSNDANAPPNVSQDLNHTVALESPSLHLPHHLFEAQKSRSLMGVDKENIMHIDSSLGSAMIEKLPASEAIEKSVSDCASKHSTSFECSAPSSMGQELQDYSKTLEGPLLDVREISTDSCDLPESSVCRLPKSNDMGKLLTSDIKNDLKTPSSGAFQETPVKARCSEVSAAIDSEVSAAIEVKNVEAREVKKTSDKKSRKSKSSKAQTSSDHTMEAAKASRLQQSKSVTECINDDEKSQVSVLASVPEIRDAPHQAEIDSVPANLHDGDLESEFKGDQKQNDCITQQSAQVNSAHRAWKPAVCVKPKSLLEIQQEEQRRVQMEIPASGVSPSVTSVSLPTPWSGVVHSEPKVSGEIHVDGSNSESNIGKSKGNKKKSELHDLLAQEVLAKSNEKNIEVSHITGSLPSLPSISTQTEAVDDDSFIEAKDTKKSRKKAAKAKGAGTKASVSTSADVMVVSSPIVKGKTCKHVQAEEVLPAPPSGPSLGDYVTWKGESMSPSPAPAWSTDSVKLLERTSLRDILKEQEKKVISSPQHSQALTQKTQSAQTRAVSWSTSASPPSEAALPVQINSHVSSQSKCKGEDDLFWGSPDQTKQQTRQVDYPQLGKHGSRATKSTPAKGVSAPSLGRQKSVSGRPAEHSVSSFPVSAQSSAKGKRNGNNKHSEAMDFKDWCESESVRLTGSKDTSFLEFCLKQSRSEAEILLTENLGSFDPNHEFIEKFLNYMELLPADVLEIAFRSQNDMKASSTRVIDMTSNDVGFGDIERDYGGGADGSAKGSKKKGKKGKKVSPSVLGFNVVSNRIMMGEILNVED